MRHRHLFVAVAAIVLIFASARVATAHEPRVFNGLDAEAGWANEPPTTGVLNAVFLHAVRGTKPATDLKLTVQVVYAGTSSPELDLAPSDEEPGVYKAAFIPTRPGDYTFHITGTAGRARVDQTFAPGKGVEEVGEATELEFPVKDPPVAQLADRATRLESRLTAAKSDAKSANTLALIALVVGALALLGSVVAAGTRRKARAPS
jgi:hypothetical protein